MKFRSKYKTFHSWKCICEMTVILSGERWVNEEWFRLQLTHAYIAKSKHQTTKIKPGKCWCTQDHIDGLVQDCSNSIVNATGILLIGPLGTNFSEILSEIHTFSFKKMRLKMSSGKCRPFCLGLNVLTILQRLYLAPKLRAIYNSLAGIDWTFIHTSSQHQPGIKTSKIANYCH